MSDRRLLVTGGAGFIGAAVAEHHLAAGRSVTIFDDFSRGGAVETARDLQNRYGDRLDIIEGSICDPGTGLDIAVEECDAVYHLAAQVAVTTSVRDPRHDFEVNALGTFNVLESRKRLVK